jgi:hypothetical protein
MVAALYDLITSDEVSNHDDKGLAKHEVIKLMS